jgi:hypothetical protein
MSVERGIFWTMVAPINVKLASPTIPIPNWNQEEKDWMNLNTMVHGNPGFYPLTVKAAYVMGVEYDICKSVSYLLASPDAKTTTYIPAYGVFASGVELLGRCINGNPGTSGCVADLKTGFKWLVSTSFATVHDTDIVISTSICAYTVKMLVALRHFAAHGQATSQLNETGTHKFSNIDHEILSMTPPLVADGLERYWTKLWDDEDLCNKLAKANIIALRDWPVLRSWSMFERDQAGQHHGISELFNEFDWHVNG